MRGRYNPLLDVGQLGFSMLLVIFINMNMFML